jgi:hypothetical protein
MNETTMKPTTLIACPECGFGWNDYTQGQHYDHCSQSPVQPVPDAGGEWRVEAMPTHGWRVVDATGQELVADVYRKEDAMQIVAEHNAVGLLVEALMAIRQKVNGAILAGYQKPSSYVLELQDVDDLTSSALATAGRRS